MSTVNANGSDGPSSKKNSEGKSKNPSPSPQRSSRESSKLRSSSQHKEVTTTSSATTTSTPVESAPQSSTSVKKGPCSNSSFKDQLFTNMGRMINGGGITSPNASSVSRRASGVSPSRITRLHEKEDLQNLNDRLVVYIDTVRRLESENNRLQSVVMSYNENSSRDINDIKSLYEKELEDAKRLIDELAKEKACFEINYNKSSADSVELSKQLEKLRHDYKTVEGKFKNIESECLEYKSRYESLSSESARKREELDQLRPAHADLVKSQNKLRRQLEDETLLRVDVENKNQTLKEDLQFKSQIYDKEVDQLRSSKRVEIEEVDVRLRDEYDSRLVNELQRVRDETETKISEMKEEVERRFQNKQKDLAGTIKRLNAANEALKEELTSAKLTREEHQQDLKQAQARLAQQEVRTRELEDKLRRQATKNEKESSDKDTKLDEVNQQIQELMINYEDLYDVKINLDREIASYRKLLESEEQRLNISSFQQHSTTNVASNSASNNQHLSSSYLGEQDSYGQQSKSMGGTGRAKKRKQANVAASPEDSPLNGSSGSTSSTVLNFTQKQHSVGGVEIGEHDMDGRSVRLVNTTEKDVSIGGWILKRSVDGCTNQIEFKFANRAVLKQGVPITVWSSNAGQQPQPPNELVLPQAQSWTVGDTMMTILVDNKQSEQSRRESRKVQALEKKPRASPQAAANTSTGGTVSKFFSFFK